MHAVVMDVTINDPDAAVRGLDEQFVPLVSGSPGFVAAYWIARSGGKGLSVLVFDSQASAEAFRAQAGDGPPDGSVTLEVAEVGEVLRSA